MAAYVKLFFTDGDVQVSESPTLTNAIIESMLVEGEAAGISLYAKADVGYSIADCTWTPTTNGAPDTSADWALAPDANGVEGTYGTYGDPINLGTVTNASPVPFWVKAKSTVGEVAQNDDTVTLEASGTVSAVS